MTEGLAGSVMAHPPVLRMLAVVAETALSCETSASTSRGQASGGGGSNQRSALDAPELLAEVSEGVTYLDGERVKPSVSKAEKKTAA